MELFFRKFGKGPAMIILHGLYGSSDNWLTVGKTLSRSFEVFLPDLRNHGRSPHTKEHTYTLLKNDLYDFMKSRDLEKAIITGHSMGGKAALFFALDYPEKVSSLIVIDISPRSYKSLDEFSPQSVDHMNILTAMLSVDFSSVKNRVEVEKLLSSSIKSPRIRQFLLKNVQRNHDGSFKWKINVQTLHDNLPAVMDGLHPDKLKEKAGTTIFPVLFIKGEKSDYIQDKDELLIRSVFPSAKIVTIPRAGHWLHAEQPELLIKTIEYFLSGQ